MLGAKHVLLGADSVELANEAVNQYQPYAVEYLNSFVSPLHIWNLKPVVCYYAIWIPQKAYAIAHD
jgi:hypothetical protein